ncbi:MAG: tRNA glutamyl-Q(34) synthetase GluQRS [Pseudomonadota bacterium]
MPLVTRFAPSPNGPMHRGHAFSAVVAHDLAHEAGGEFLLRIEDIDGGRTRPELIDEYRRNLEWLGLEWREVPAQSTRLERYAQAASDLIDRGLLYPCVCTRKEIEAAGARRGEEGLIYPGTCKGKRLDPTAPVAWRLDVEKAMAEAGRLVWSDEEAGCVEVDPSDFGDLVIVRKDAPASYHLAVVLDDAEDGVTLVTRGRDLFAASHIHRLLQALFDLPVPRWHHHGLLMDDQGKKLSKRRGTPALGDQRRAGENGRALAEKLRVRWRAHAKIAGT